MFSALLLASTLTIRADRVIDGRGHVLPNAAVIVDGGRIVGIDQHPKYVDVDLGDRTLMPGGVDTHVHIGWHFDADGRSHDDETDRNESPESTALFAAESVRRAVLAGCNSIEHGVLIGQPELDLMAEHGTYFDPNIDLVFRNYFENKPHFLGIGNYTEEGFAQMRNAVPKALQVFQLALKTPKLKVVFGTDAVAGSHGRNFQELEYRVRTGGQKAIDAITSATSLAAESLGLGSKVGTIAPGYAADLIAVDGNPLTDVGALEHVSFVMKDGKVLKR